MNEFFLNIFGDFHYLSIFVLALNEDILKEVVIVLLGKQANAILFITEKLMKILRKGQNLHLLIGDIGEMAPVGSFRRVLRVDVEVLEEDRLRKRRLVVDPRTPFTVGARASLDKLAVNIVLKIVLPFKEF